MRRLVVSVLVLAAIGGAGIVHAQKGLSTGPNIDAMDNARRIAENKIRELDKPRKAGLEALQAQDFVEAEKKFADLVSRDPTTSDANYLMALALMGQKKWPEAKQYLDVAVVKEPKRPDPKARLAVASIMINDIPTAQAQRTELLNMKDSCGNCKDAGLIASNLAMVDKVIAAVNTPTTAAPATPG